MHHAASEGPSEWQDPACLKLSWRSAVTVSAGAHRLDGEMHCGGVDLDQHVLLSNPNFPDTVFRAVL
jgi:hypothetical protein